MFVSSILANIVLSLGAPATGDPAAVLFAWRAIASTNTFLTIPGLAILIGGGLPLPDAAARTSFAEVACGRKSVVRSTWRWSSSRRLWRCSSPTWEEWLRVGSADEPTLRFNGMQINVKALEEAGAALNPIRYGPYEPKAIFGVYRYALAAA